METNSNNDDVVNDSTNSKESEEDEVRYLSFCQIFAPSDYAVFMFDPECNSYIPNVLSNILNYGKHNSKIVNNYFPLLFRTLTIVLTLSRF